jgi:hypothetical protein
MAHKELALAFMILAAPPAFAANPEDPAAAAPAASEDAKYCMRVEPATGSRIEMVRCWTRREWAELGVDVDRDWPKEGVRVIG